MLHEVFKKTRISFFSTYKLLLKIYDTLILFKTKKKLYLITHFDNIIYISVLNKNKNI